MGSEAVRAETDGLVRAVLGVLHRMVWADGDADPREIQVGIDVARKMLGDLFIEDEVSFTLATMTGPDLQLDILPEDARLIVLRAAAEVAGADQIIDPTEVVALQELGAELGVNPSVVRGVLDGLQADTDARKELDALKLVAADILGVEVEASAAEVLERYRTLVAQEDDDRIVWAYHTLLG